MLERNANILDHYFTPKKISKGKKDLNGFIQNIQTYF